jgi:hypothetical protein
MRTTQNNRVRMFKTVTTVLDENHDVWSGMAPFAASLQRLKAKITDIDTAAQKQNSATHGATLDRTTARADLEDVLFLSCEALGVLAHSAGDNQLRKLTDLKPSDFQRLADEELSNTARGILTETTGRKTELATLQVTQENLDELNKALQEFNASKSAPRAAIANRMAQTEALPQLITDANDILRNELDRMVNLFRRSHPDFVAAYRGARVIVDRVATRESKPPVAPAPHPFVA